MTKPLAALVLAGLLLIPGSGSAQDWRDRIGEKFELSRDRWLDKATLVADRALGSSACRETPRFHRSYDVVRNFFRDPKNFHDDILMNTKSQEDCECARWIVTRQRADWQDVLDYADQPRCGPDSSRRECLAGGATPRACAEGENPFPFKEEPANP